MDVRRVSPDDWRTLRDVRLAALREAPYAFGSSYARELAYDEARWRAWVTTGACLLCWQAGEPVGIAVGVADPDEPDERHLVSMWVRTSARGTGAADVLVRAICGWARGEGAASLTLWVADGNERARRFYESAGFRRTGLRQPLPSNPAVGEEQLRLAL